MLQRMQHHSWKIYTSWENLILTIDLIRLLFRGWYFEMEIGFCP